MLNSILAATPLITNDAVVLGVLLIVLAAIFWTAHSDIPFFKKFYTYVPSLLLCYFIPAILSSVGLISDDKSNLYFVASRYLLPTSLVLLTISIDLKGVFGLGPKALIMFLTGTVGIIIGGPIALYMVGHWMDPTLLQAANEGDEVWRGLATVAGSWIGGGANQAAMLEIFGAGDTLFSVMIIIDVFVANIWMAVLLYGAGVSNRIDRSIGADNSAVESLKQKIINYQKKVMRIPNLTDITIVMAVGFGATAFAHLGADLIVPWVTDLSENNPVLQRMSLTSGFFWLIVIATTVGVLLSFTKARKLEGVGASRAGSLMLYILVATIGMKMDIKELYHNWADYKFAILVGLIWMAIHSGLLLSIGKIIRAPFFFTAVGSQANVGGAASAPIVASAFHPSLAPVGVLLAVVGYALGTYGAWLCGLLMQWVYGL